MPQFGWGFQVEIRGIKQLMRKLDGLPKSLRRKGLRNALAAGGGVAKRSAKPASPVETGLLSRSWRALFARSRNKDEVKYRVQPKKGGKTAVRKTARGLLRAVGKKRAEKLRASGERLRYRYPIRYAHLVELGHDLRKGSRGGRLVGHVRGRHFLRDMFESKRNQITRTVRERLAKEIIDAARKKT